MIDKIKEKIQKRRERILWERWKNCSGKKDGYCMGFFMYLLVQASKEIVNGKNREEAWAELLKFQAELLEGDSNGTTEEL